MADLLFDWFGFKPNLSQLNLTHFLEIGKNSINLYLLKVSPARNCKIHLSKPLLQEPWFSGYGRRLISERL